MAKQNKVCVNLDQSNEQNGGFSDAEKLRARNNIGAGDGKVSWVFIPEGGQPQISRSGLSVVSRSSGAYIQNDDASVKFYLVPVYEAGDAGKILGINNGGYLGWRSAPRELPSSTQQDANKALIVDANGNPIWGEVKPSIKQASRIADVQVNWTYSGTSSNFSKAAIVIENLTPNKMHRINLSVAYRQNFAAGFVFAASQESNLGVPMGYGRIAVKTGAYDAEYDSYILNTTWDLLSSNEGKLFINMVGDADPSNTRNKVFIETCHYQVVQTEL